MAGEGGKVAGLRELSGFAPVPPFVVVAADALGEAEGIVAAAAADGLRPPYAVRSSADVEDGDAAAFAGMFETRLRVRAAELRTALDEVAASVRSERIDAYLAANGSNARHPTGMHMIVQNMVDARVAGVCASRLPESGSDVASIEAVLGLGELLVSGTVEPDLYRVARSGRSVLVERIGNQVMQLSLAAGEELVPPTARQARKLSDAEAVAVADLAFEVESRTGWAAADIEWAFEGEVLWALQARPVASVKAVPQR
jgi:phosphoenolpyruvate synthase/pyruvate phosphate dikinase